MRSDSPANSGINFVPTQSGRKTKWLIVIVEILLIAFITTFNYGGCGFDNEVNSGSSGIRATLSGQSLLSVTNPATDIIQTTAKLNGTVNPNGVATNVYFEYGRTTTYNLYTNYQYIGAGTAPINVSASLTGLLPNTTYNFRIKVVKNSSIYNGETQTFTTSGLKPICVTNPATNVTFNSATLNGTVNANTLATTGYFNYGLTTSYGSTTLSQPIGSGTSNFPVSFDINGLSSSTLYNFRVVGTNANGTTYGNNLTFTTTN
jgi:hypothetical protein